MLFCLTIIACKVATYKLDDTHAAGEKMITGRRLQAAAAEATPSDGWGLGRVSWTNPSLKYQQQILNYT